MDKILNLDFDNILKKLEFQEKKKIVIKNILKNNFAEDLFTYITKIPNKRWFYSCGIRNSRYEGRNTIKNTKKNNDNIREANRSFSKDEFSYNLLRAMDWRKKEISKYEIFLRKLLSSNLFLSMVSYITDLKITSLNQMFLSKYKSGSFLSPHSDIGNGKLAYILNLTKDWKPQYGGILHFLNEERTKITESYVPEFNSLILFYVPEEGIPHFVSHVAPHVKKNRYAITGWLS